jgi:hypothetical protein
MFNILCNGEQYIVPTKSFGYYPPFSIEIGYNENCYPNRLVVGIYNWNYDGSDYSCTGDAINFYFDGRITLSNKGLVKKVWMSELERIIGLILTYFSKNQMRTANLRLIEILSSKSFLRDCKLGILDI